MSSNNRRNNDRKGENSSSCDEDSYESTKRKHQSQKKHGSSKRRREKSSSSDGEVRQSKKDRKKNENDSPRNTEYQRLGKITLNYTCMSCGERITVSGSKNVASGKIYYNYFCCYKTVKCEFKGIGGHGDVLDSMDMTDGDIFDNIDAFHPANAIPLPKDKITDELIKKEKEDRLTKYFIDQKLTIKKGNRNGGKWGDRITESS